MAWQEQADCKGFEKPEHFAGPPKGKSDAFVGGGSDGGEVPPKKTRSSKQPVQKPAAA